MAMISDMADLRGAQNFEEIIDRLKKYKKEKNLSDSDYILAFGYDHTVLEENDHPTRDLLDQVSKTNPIFLLHSSGHIGVSNTKGLEENSIGENTKDPQGGHIRRSKDSNIPNGLLEESALSLVMGPRVMAMDMDYDDLYTKVQDIYIKYGITTIQDGAVSPDGLGNLTSLAKNDLLKIYTNVYILATDDVSEVLENHPQIINKYDNRLKFAGYKIILDGSPQGKTAWLTSPYEGEDSYQGYGSMDDADVIKHCKMAIDDGQQILAHANGDKAADQFINSYEKALDESKKWNERPKYDTIYFRRPYLIMGRCSLGKLGQNKG